MLARFALQNDVGFGQQQQAYSTTILESLVHPFSAGLHSRRATLQVSTLFVRTILLYVRRHYGNQKWPVLSARPNSSRYAVVVFAFGVFRPQTSFRVVVTQKSNRW